MLPISRAIFSHAYLLYFLMLTLNLSIQHIHAADHEGKGSTSLPSVNNSIREVQTLILGTPSTKTFSFLDVYHIELSLNISGNIELIATEGDVITVTLEKQARKTTNTKQDDLIRDYLDSITFTGTHSGDTLQLRIQLSNNSSETQPNSLSNAEVLQAARYDGLQLKCRIKTPADVSVQLHTKTGDISVQRIRGKIETSTETGNVHLDETVGNYNVRVTKGNIDGKILLTHGQNKLETQNGSIGLEVLDPVASPMDITAQAGSIRLRLPENYAADVELESEKQQIVVNLPAQFDEVTGLTIINDGGPLFRLKATNLISLLPSASSSNTSADTETDLTIDFAQPVPQVAQPPTIDGNLSEIVWQAAARLSPLQNPDGTEAPSNTTETFLMWDAENFYVGVKAHLSDSLLPYVSQTQHDSPIWEDECIEILIDPNPKTDVYYHLVINPIGAYFDQQVNTPGEPSFQFAPHDVQLTLNRKTLQTAFKANSAWNSNAKVASQINAAFWSLEVAFPRKMLEPAPKMDPQSTSSFENKWLFNIHRKMHSSNMKSLIPATSREYSYWLPIYDTERPWWPHTPQEYTGPLAGRYGPAMGILEFITTPLASEDFASKTKVRVATIEIKGNTTISTEAVQQALPIQVEDVITSSQLSWLIAELQEQGWFQDVRLETQQVDVANEESISSQQATGRQDWKDGRLVDGGKYPIFPSFNPPINLHIRVTEAPVLFAQQIKIEGNRSFPSRFIKEWFQLESGYLAVAIVRLKERLIADFYANRGYEFATVTHRIDNDVLEFSIDEGTLHEIRFTGNSRIPRAELLSALNLSTGNGDGEGGSQASDIYHHALGQSKINGLRQELSKNSEHFKSVRNWHVQREGGKNVMIIDIEEQPFARPGGFPILQFNRVHGLMLGAGGTLSTQLTGKERVFGSISHGFSSKIWNYHAGIEKGFFKRQLLKFGGGFYKLTDVSSNLYLHQGEASLSASYYGSALQDYYQRQGAQGWITYALSEWSYLRLEFTGERHDNLSKSTDWSYLNRNLIKRGNSRINRGQLRSLSLVYAFDTRDHRSTITRHFHTLFSANERTRRGWRGQFAVEIAGNSFGGDHAFNFYRFELARYTPVSGAHHLNVRIAGDFSDAPLPRQRLLHLGGGNTLRGHDSNVFAGDNRFLINLEYRFIKETIPNEQDGVLGWTLSCFMDAGRVWWYDDAPFSDFEYFMTQLEASVGIGGSIFWDPFGNPEPWSVALEVAEPLNSSFSLRNPSIILRLGRMF
ncbi:MAG: BamA/TamA family outer membrane protein [Candidatus Poribacteria bacterium]|nr:BamA/TamA family outer membrane protein [Candidatus Poribacteria bacterium]